MRDLGDKYVKAEFRLHKNAEGSTLTQFLGQWQVYYDTITGQDAVMGMNMAPNVVEDLSDAQKQQLLQMRHETQAPQ
jgi:hypothetical protein